jgi:sugar lactone lactonase YvrE
MLVSPRLLVPVAVLGLLVTAAPATSVGARSTITTVAGSGAGFRGDGGPASEAQLEQPRDTALAPDGSIYVTDTFNHRIRRIDTDGTITTIAGTGSQAWNGDGIAATSASLSMPHDVTVRRNGVVYIADSGHHRIRRVGLDGTITTVAGTGSAGSTGDGGPATQAQIRSPKSVAIHDGGLYFSSLENKVRRVDLRTGTITTVAGTGEPGYAGDGGPATAALLHSPQRIAIDSRGTIYVADSDNNVVRRIGARSGVITTVAGTGVAGSSGDGGPAASALLDHPRGLALDGDDRLYVADSNNHRVRRVNLTTGKIRLVAGTTRGYSGDGGEAGSAQLYQPRGLTVLADHSLLVADSFNNRLRLISSP